jgi:hypothetical protein
MIKVNTKICFKCKIEKDSSCFHADKRNTTTGLYSWCKSCKTAKTNQWNKDNFNKKKNGNYLRQYGISLQDYQEMKKAQNNCCATCDRNESELKRSLMVDHCHTSGKIRGLLCDECNLSLGKIKDNIQTLEKMILYLKIKT